MINILSNGLCVHFNYFILFFCLTGSSVVTSFCAGEAVEKHVALLEVNNKQLFNVTPLKLETVRPFVFDVSII